jgi:hypothetical protein
MVLCDKGAGIPRNSGSPHLSPASGLVSNLSVTGAQPRCGKKIHRLIRRHVPGVINISRLCADVSSTFDTVQCARILDTCGNTHQRTSRFSRGETRSTYCTMVYCIDGLGRSKMAPRSLQLESHVFAADTAIYRHFYSLNVI